MSQLIQPHLPTLALAALLGLGSTQLAAQGEVTYFTGPAGGLGDVLVLDATGGGQATTAAGLSGVELLPLDFSGRSALNRLLPDRPRLRSDVAGGDRILLPGGQGSLYRFRRPEGAGATFGWFLVDGAGAARVLFEQPGSGPTGDGDPFLERVGVAPDGGAFLVATQVAAGGDLFEVDLAGAATLRTANLAPRTFDDAGPTLLGGWGTAVSQEGLVRFDRSPGAMAEAIAISGIPAPAYWDGGMACSANETMVATVAGASASQAHVLCFGPTGTATALDTTPQVLVGAGFQPDSTAGPTLALSADGSVASWMTEGAAREAWMGRTSPPPGEVPEQLTENMHFVDTLDEIGLIGFFNATNMLLGVGETADPLDPASTDIDGMDLYLASMDAGGNVSLSNLSLTSGNPIEPFTKGELSTEAGVMFLPGQLGVVAHNPKNDTLTYIDGSGSQTVLNQVKSLEAADASGNEVLLHIRREGLALDHEVIALSAASPTSVTTLGQMPGEVVVSRIALRGDGWAGFVVRFGTKEWLVRSDLASGFVQLALSQPLAYGSAVGFTPGGDLALTVGAPGSPSLAGIWTAAGNPIPLPLPVTAMQLLPGAS